MFGSIFCPNPNTSFLLLTNSPTLPSVILPILLTLVLFNFFVA